MALKKEQLGTTVFVVTVDLSRPWRVMRCLDRWCAELDAAVAATDMPSAEASQLQRRQREYVQARYANGVDGALPDLPKGLLDDSETPHGVPLVVVGTHSERLFELRSGTAAGPAPAAAEANAVQYHLRRFCLKRGATLVFVPTDSAAAAEEFASSSSSSKAPGSILANASGQREEFNSGSEQPHVPSALLLQQYLLHRLYPSAFAFDAAAFDFNPERPDDELFLCAGQDSPSLANQLELGPLDGLSFEEAVPAPPNWAGPTEEESGDAQSSLVQSAPGTTAAGVRGGKPSSNGEEEPSLEFDDSAWLAGLRASLNTAQAQRAVQPRTTTGGSKAAAAAKPAPAAQAAAAAPTGGAPPLPPPPRSTRATAKSSDAAGAKDFFSSLLNS